jgi:hypothetical protein
MFLTHTEVKGQRNDNVPDSYSGGIQFESSQDAGYLEFFRDFS